MEPPIPDLRGVPKRDAYAQLMDLQQLMLEGHHDVIAGMATASALLHHAFKHLWTGFYRVVDPGKLLRVGPYQGTLGCLDITVGRGVCGTAAAELRTIVVPDVADFPGHITCDPRARSEIVVPVVNNSGELFAVLDIDSETPNAFDEHDQRGLEQMMRWFAQVPASDIS